MFLRATEVQNKNIDCYVLKYIIQCLTNILTPENFIKQRRLIFGTIIKASNFSFFLYRDEIAEL